MYMEEIQQEQFHFQYTLLSALKNPKTFSPKIGGKFT